MLNTVLSLPEFPEFPGFDPNGSFDPNSSYNIELQANNSYVITRDHCLGDNDLRIPANVTLYFMGGKILPNPMGVNSSSSEGTVLVGNQTKVVARIEQIFDSSLKVEGTWLIDRAYPQWFGAIGYPYLKNYESGNDTEQMSNPADSSDAINKAIEMKQTGEVFLPRGTYFVKKTIFVPNGIKLIGESGHPTREDNYPTVLMTDANVNDLDVANTSFSMGYLIMANIRHNGSQVIMNTKKNIPDWEVAYSFPGTEIKHIVFRNTRRKIKNLKGIYSAANIELYGCIWDRFQQALRCADYYLDMNRVERCLFNGAGDFHGEVLYVFDFSYLGDALVFENNHINGKRAKGVNLRVCNGASITSNIINCDVSINSSKGIVFHSNHMEEGAQISITASNVSLFNNFIWKGARPNLIVKASNNQDISAVSSVGNLFLFRDNQVGNEPPYDIENISEYDILTDGSVSLRIEQNYRCFLPTTARMYTCGIKIGSLEEDDMTEFNDYSYMLSTSSLIMPDTYIAKSFRLDDVKNNIGIGISTVNYSHSDVTWTLDTDVYYYRGHAIWDINRKIVSPVKDLGNYRYEKDQAGTFFSISGKNGRQLQLRLYRGTLKNGVPTYDKYVDVPCCGSRHLHDNGISICGYKWKDFDGQFLSGNTQIETLSFKGKNIECQAPSVPTSGTWQKGDIVYNTGISTVSMWIYLSGNWVAR